MEAVTRSATLGESIEEVRRLLQPALFEMQEQENAADEAVRDEVMAVSAALAEVVGGLYQASRKATDDGLDVTATVSEAYGKLERTRKRMDDLPGTEEERQTVAQALALLFALGVGPRSSCPPPRRSSAAIRAVKVPKKSKTAVSSPNIELGEIDAAALGLDVKESKTGISSPSIELGEIDAAALGIDLDSEASSLLPTEEQRDESAEPEEIPGAERRSSPRIAFEVEVGFVSESHFYAGLSMDVSDGGLFVATYRVQPVGSQVAVTFILPNGHAVTTNAEVQWVRGESEDASPGMGLAFDLKGEDKKQVRTFCERRQPLFIDMD